MYSSGLERKMPNNIKFETDSIAKLYCGSNWRSCAIYNLYLMIVSLDRNYRLVGGRG